MGSRQASECLGSGYIPVRVFACVADQRLAQMVGRIDGNGNVGDVQLGLPGWEGIRREGGVRQVRVKWGSWRSYIA